MKYWKVNCKSKLLLTLIKVPTQHKGCTKCWWLALDSPWQRGRVTDLQKTQAPPPVPFWKDHWLRWDFIVATVANKTYASIAVWCRCRICWQEFFCHHSTTTSQNEVNYARCPLRWLSCIYTGGFSSIAMSPGLSEFFHTPSPHSYPGKTWTRPGHLKHPQPSPISLPPPILGLGPAFADCQHG